MFVNDVFQADVSDVGVDLGGVDVGVSEHKLYGTQIDAVVDEVGGEGVAQAVRAERGDAGGFGVVFAIIHASWREMPLRFWLTKTSSQILF